MPTVKSRAAAAAALVVATVAAAIAKGSCACTFGSEFQGEFAAQASSSSSSSSAPSAPTASLVQYGRIVIAPDAINVWGNCHAAVKSNNHSVPDAVILKESSSSGTCFRCFRIWALSANVVRVEARSVDRCFTVEDTARRFCPDRSEQDTVNTMLFRIPDEVVSTKCPLDGRFTVSSVSSSGNAHLLVSEGVSASVASTCPNGDRIDFRLEKGHVAFRCLGEWAEQEEGAERTGGTDKFVALMEDDDGRGGDIFDGEHKPLYRCGLLTYNAASSKWRLKLSPDATCPSVRSDLTGISTSGADSADVVFVLAPVPQPKWPTLVRKATCKFPSWTQGTWESVSVSGSWLSFRKEHSLATFEAACVQQSLRHSNRFLIYSRSQCGSAEYNCVWLQRRGLHVLEYQLGLRPSNSPSFDLCDNDHFLQRTWNTQARLSPSPSSSPSSPRPISPCPLSGDFVGVLPDAPSLCSRLTSDCTNTHRMTFAVTECQNITNVYEERSYECVGQWEESGTVLAYARLLSSAASATAATAAQHECFVGAVDSSGRLFLMEAGADCRRGLRVTALGMQLKRRSSCPNAPSTPSPSRPWFIPTTKTTSTTSASSESSSTVICRNEGDNEVDHDLIEDLSTKPWQPMTSDGPMNMASPTDRASAVTASICLVLAVALARFSNRI